jgi:hypothetical protein
MDLDEFVQAEAENNGSSDSGNGEDTCSNMEESDSGGGCTSANTSAGGQGGNSYVLHSVLVHSVS